MSVNSQNNESLDHSPTKVKSKSPFSSNVLQYKKSLTSIQMSQTTKEASDSANSDDTKHVIYPNSERTYKPKQNPPDLALSLKHQKAHRVAPLESLLTSTDTCESTGVPFTDRKLPLCSKINQIYHLGPVFPMYFLLIKQIAVIMIFLCLLAGALALLQLQSTVKPSSYIDYIDILYQSGLQTTTMVMGSLCIILVLLFILYKFRQQHKRTKRKCKGGNLSCSDYTVMSSNLADRLSEQELKSFFSHFIVPNYSLDVVKVTKTYDIETYIWKIRQLSRLVRERQDIVAHLKGEPSGSDLMRFEDLEKEIEAINDYFSKRETELTNFQLLEKNDVCFVTFNTRQEAKVVKRRFELTPVQRFFLKLTQFFSRDLNEYYLDKKFVKIQKAPEPGDIIWENLSKRKPSFWFVLAYIFFCVIIYCITSFGLWQVSNLDSSYNGWFIGLIVAITNELFYCVVSGLALWERFLTITDKRIDLAYRLILLQMINMILPIYILDLFETEFIIDRLPSYILYIAIVSFAVPLLIRLIHPRHLMKVIRRTKAQLQSHKSPLDQEQANQVFEDSEINISALYSTLIKTLLFSCFGFGTSPGIAYVGLIALIFMHWIDKYNLFRRSLIPSYMRSEIAEAMNECLDISLFLIALGSLVWSLMMFRSDAVDEHLTIMIGGSIFQVIIALIYMLLPNKRISREWTRIERRQNNWSSNLFYQQAAEYFPGNYDLCWSLAERKMQSQEIKEKYNKTMKNFGSIGILNECPEVLPMFEYGDTHPSFFKSWAQGLEGLRDPFYIYPQNYGYGFIPLLAQNNSQKSGNKLPLLHEPGAQGLKKKENLTIFSGFTANPDNRLNSNISPVHRTMQKQDTRDLFNVATEMVSAISGRQKASSGSSQGGDLNTTENESGRNKLKSETGNTMIFDSFRNEVLGERKETLESERSIMGLSPITENFLLKSGEKTDKIGRK